MLILILILIFLSMVHEYAYFLWIHLEIGLLHHEALTERLEGGGDNRHAGEDKFTEITAPIIAPIASPQVYTSYMSEWAEFNVTCDRIVAIKNTEILYFINIVHPACNSGETDYAEKAKAIYMYACRP